MKKSKSDSKNLERFLEFNGKRISVLLTDGTWYVAIKPICEALGVDYEAQRKAFSSDEILAQLPSEQTVVAADLKPRKMLCLPEMYVYGWLFSIRSDAPGLKQYKLECYQVLYQHFHGTLTGRMDALSRRLSIDSEIQDLEEKLLTSDEYLKIQELKKEKSTLGKQLKQLDKNLVTGQLTFNLG